MVRSTPLKHVLFFSSCFSFFKAENQKQLKAFLELALKPKKLEENPKKQKKLEKTKKPKKTKFWGESCIWLFFVFLVFSRFFLFFLFSSSFFGFLIRKPNKPKAVLVLALKPKKTSRKPKNQKTKIPRRILGLAHFSCFFGFLEVFFVFLQFFVFFARKPNKPKAFLVLALKPKKNLEKTKKTKILRRILGLAHFFCFFWFS